MRHLFDDKHERYTEEAYAIDAKLHAVIRPIIEEAAARGVSIRDLEYVGSQVVQSITLDLILDLKNK